MNLSIKKEFQNFEYYCKSVLNDQNPNSINKNSRSNLEILIHEIFCRSMLLMIRFSKCSYTATLLVLSPLSLIENRLSSPENAWKSFSKEVRLFSAEIFEMIGVIVCSTLLLPFNRKNFPSLNKPQIWIEKTAARISGESIDIQLTKELLHSIIKPKKELLKQARKFITLNTAEVQSWGEFISGIDTLNNRRICRQYDTAALKEKLKTKLSSFEKIISEKFVSVVIPKQKEALIRLKTLLNNQSESEMQLTFPLINSQSHLEHFDQLLSEMKKTIDELHAKYDPKNILKKSIESLKKDIDDTYSQAFNDFNEGKDHLNGFVDFYDGFYKHYFKVIKEAREIESTYQYENIAYANEEFSEDFVNDLSSRLFHCRNSLNSAQVDWKSNINPRPLDRQRALEILELPETANDSDIRRQYKKLVLIHHPDKGGKGAVFAIIKQAYDFLMKKDAP